MNTILKTLIVILTILAPLLAYSKEKCALENLKEYSLILTVSETNKEYNAKIYLPDINSVKGEFCGYWYHKELTNNTNLQYYGYKDNNSYITLNPELYDMGLGIDLTNNDQWPQKGTLIKRGIAGIKIGTFKIGSR